jgi:uncharacterized phage protein (TIGR02218 family)
LLLTLSPLPFSPLPLIAAVPEPVVNFQSPYTDQSLITYMAGRAAEMCFAWKLTPHASSVLTNPIAGTDNTRNLLLPGHGATVFRSITGITPSAIDVESGQESAGLEFTAVFDTEEFTRAAVNAGDWNSAKLEVFELSFRYPDMGQLVPFDGRIGTVHEEGRIFTAQATPLTAIGRIKIGRKTGANCDVKVLGDARCKLNLAPYTRTAQTVTAVPDVQHTFRASGLASPTVAYENGQIHWTSGDNAPRKFEIKSYDNSTKEIVLHFDTPFAIESGDVFTIIEGCNRTPDQCEQYANIINFRGFRYITNVEEIQRIIRAP